MKENWTIGSHGEVLTDTIEGLTESAGHVHPKYYGVKGLVCESIYINKDRHLIAAAPDLLEVAEETCRTLDAVLKRMLPSKEQVVLRALRAICRDAVFKANGDKIEDAINKAKQNINMKELILGLIGDLVKDFTYYDRKECETLTEDQLDKAIESGEVTIDEMVAEFRKHLEATYK